MPITVGLMGFGRIGRNLFRILHRSDDIRIGAVSDTADHEALTYLLRYDTILGRFPDEVRYSNGHLYTWGREIPMISARDPQDVDWRTYGVDYVIEAVGRPRLYKETARHIDSGAKRVVLCVPPIDPEPIPQEITVVFGVNDDHIKKTHTVISNSSCTAHCAAPLLKVLNDAFGIDRAHMSVVHAFTSEQRLADVPAGDPRLSRAAGQNIVPSESNAAHVLGEVLPELEGKLVSAALRVPVPNGSIVDMTINFSTNVAIERINDVIRTAASGPFRGILEYNEDPIVSSDIVRSEYSSTYDASATMVLDDRMAKLIAWFDNGWGYAHRAVDLIRKLAVMDGLKTEVSR